MSKAGSISLICLGAVMLYIGVMGVGGLIIYSITGTFLNEPWNSMEEWLDEYDGLCEINPPGQLHLLPAGGGSQLRAMVARNMPIPDLHTIEWRLKVDSWAGESFHLVQTYTETQWFSGVRIFQDHIEFFGKDTTPEVSFSLYTDNNWHVWTYLADGTAKINRLYRDDVLIGQSSNVFTTSGVPRVHVGMYQRTEGACECHVDYTFIDSGWKPPGTTPEPPPDTGTVYVKTYYDGVEKTSVEMGITVSLSGPEGSTMISTPYTGYDLPVGEYYATSSYGGETQSDFGALSAGGTLYLQLAWEGAAPPPNGGPDFIQWIMDLLEDPIVRSGLTIGGVFFIGVGAITLLLPGRQLISVAPRF